ncbi:MAG: hypothetical protein AB1734_02125 [Elusimicrobiota bacterium]
MPTWEEMYYTSGPYVGAHKKAWDKRDEFEKARFLELHYRAIRYLEGNLGKQPEGLDLTITGRPIVNFPKITLEVLAMYYRKYGDLRKAAELKYKFWADAGGSPVLGYAEEDPLDFVILGYEEAGMHKEVLPFYEKRYQDYARALKDFLGEDLSDFDRYRGRYPQEAENYLSFMEGWERAKKLAKTSKPKPLDPAVQHHKWFYSDKTEEVLKALEYYRKHKVRFMFEKALKDKRPVIAKKAQEYLDNWDKPEPGVIVSTAPEKVTK